MLGNVHMTLRDRGLVKHSIKLSVTLVLHLLDVTDYISSTSAPISSHFCPNKDYYQIWGTVGTSQKNTGPSLAYPSRIPHTGEDSWK